MPTPQPALSVTVPPQNVPSTTSASAADAPAPPPVRIHLGHIDGLRALAALFVLCVHYLPIAWAEQPPANVVFKALAKLLSGGHFAVSTFIVISGFCLMLPVLRDGLTVRGGYARFLPRRFWRIAPPMYAAFLLSVLLLPLTFDAERARMLTLADGLTPKILLGHLFMTHHLTGVIPNNGVLWSVGVEWWIYFWFIPLLWVWRQFGAGLACAGGVTLTFALAAIHDYVYNVPLLFFPQYTGLFILGAWAAWLTARPVEKGDDRLERVRNHPAWLLVSVISFAVLGAIVAKLGWENAYKHISMLDAFIAVSIPALLIALLQPRHQWLRGLLGCKPLAWVGVFSYSLYLVHYPLQVAFLPRLLAFFPGASQSVRFALILTLFVPVIALAYGFYRAFELPFHKIARRF